MVLRVPIRDVRETGFLERRIPSLRQWLFTRFNRELREKYSRVMAKLDARIERKLEAGKYLAEHVHLPLDTYIFCEHNGCEGKSEMHDIFSILKRVNGKDVETDVLYCRKCCHYGKLGRGFFRYEEDGFEGLGD